MELNIRCAVDMTKAEVIEALQSAANEQFPKWRTRTPIGKVVDFMAREDGCITLLYADEEPKAAPGAPAHATPTTEAQADVM